MHKKQLDPLIPLDRLKKVVKGLIAVPKVSAAPKIERAKQHTKKRGRR